MNSVSYVTLRRDHPDFNDYLMGVPKLSGDLNLTHASSAENSAETSNWLKFSLRETIQILPLESLNVSTGLEVVTFKLSPKKEMAPLVKFKCFLETLRLQNLFLVMAPFFLGLVFLVQKSATVTQGFLFQSLVFAFVLAQLTLVYNLRNDVQDHLLGFDRVFTRSGSQAIQKGWFSAYRILQMSRAILASAFLSSLLLLMTPTVPFLFSRLPVLVGFGLAGVFFLILHTRLGNSGLDGIQVRRSWWGELIWILLSGPMISLSTFFFFTQSETNSSESGLSYDFNHYSLLLAQLLVLGGCWGLVAFAFKQLKIFRQLMVFNKAGIDTWMTRLGFDKTQKILFSFGCLAHTLFSLCIVYLFEGWLLKVIAVSFAVIFIFCFSQVLGISVILGSRFDSLVKRLLRLHLIYALVLALAAFALYVSEFKLI